MKPHDLVVEELVVATGLVQGWGTVCTRPFQFRAKHGFWEFAVFENTSLGPWDIDRPGEEHLGMHIIQRHSEALTREDAERAITRCADAYLYMIGRRQSDLSSG